MSLSRRQIFGYCVNGLLFLLLNPVSFGLIGIALGDPKSTIIFAGAFFLATLSQAIFGFPLYSRVLQWDWRPAGDRRPARDRREGVVEPLLMLASAGMYVLALASFFVAAPEPEVLLAAGVLPLAAALLDTAVASRHRRARASLKFLDDLAVPSARRLNAGVETLIPTLQLKPGDRVVVLAGEPIPTDGTLVQGMSSADESLLTAEFRPVFKQKGDVVLASTLNRDRTITIEVTKPPGENTLQSLIKLLRAAAGDSQEQSRPAERLRFALTMGALLLAAAAFADRFFRLHDSPFTALAATFGVLAVAVPYHLVAIIACERAKTVGGLAQAGIIVRAPGVLEKLSRIQTLFFDKTGTFTRGTFTYSQMFTEHGINQGRFLATLFSIEGPSRHPLSRGMETHPWYNELHKYPISDFQLHQGLGVCATVRPQGEEPYLAAAGNLRFLKRLQMHISRDMRAKIEELESVGETAVLCGYGGEVRGVMSFSDVIRPRVRETLREIQALGVEPGLITGDTEATLTHLTGSLGINKIYSHCIPQEKHDKIKREQAQGKVVGLVSDGFHEVLSHADVALTLDAGSVLLTRPAGVLIPGSSFALIAVALRLSKTCFTRIARLRTASAIYHALSLPLATTGWIPAGMTALFPLLYFGLILARRRSQSEAGLESPPQPSSMRME